MVPTTEARVAANPILYRIDAGNIITGIEGPWVEFARANGWDAGPEEVVGRSLLDFISGVDAKKLTLDILARIRSAETRATIPFRCDSSSSRRFLKMTVESEPNGGVRFETVTVREEPRSPIGWLEQVSEEPFDWITCCSWCKRLKGEGNGWEEIEEAIEKWKVFERTRMPAITHGICDACAIQVRSGIYES